jgi:acetyl esterase/lipase
MIRVLASFLVFLNALLLAVPSAAQPMTLKAYLDEQGPAPDARIPYGPAASQYVEFFRPIGAGPHPVVVLLHGGCWAHKYGGLRQVAGMARVWAESGIGVWSIEYRGVDESGGGFPGTYLDVAAALEKLKADSATLDLDLARVVFVGHSAGAQLAQWSAARSHIDEGSPLYARAPLTGQAVVGLGTLPDLRDKQAIERACGLDANELTGLPGPGREDVFADTSPAAMLPPDANTILLNGELDSVAPAALAARYALDARRAGGEVRTLVIPNASHYDEVSTDSPVWPVLDATVKSALGVP